MSGRVEAITAKAVILCTGGCGRVFPFTTNANIKNGDGMALAYRAGAPLKDMEFVQYHPTGLPFTGILITEAARAEGGCLINKDGYRYLQDYDLGKPEPKPVLRSMELGPRDRLSQAFVKEAREGPDRRDAVRPGRPPRPAPPGREGHQHQAPVRPRAVPEVPEHRPGPRADPGAAGGPLHDGRRPHRHHGATPLAGLYAAGEVACVSINGANRLGSNSLPELLVFGARAGRAAAEYAAGAARPRARRCSPRPRTSGGGWSASSSAATAGASGSADAPRRDAEDHGGGRRHLPHGGLAGQGGRQAARAAGAVPHRRLEDHSRTFNTELVAALELAFMLDVAETIVHSACGARSRAARTSGPTSRPATTSGSSPTRWPTATPTARAAVEYLPVTITRWPPGERVYGR